MRLHRAAVSTALMGVIAIILLVVGAAAGYYVGQGSSPGASASTVTSTVTQTANPTGGSGSPGASTVTITSTVTATGSGASGGSSSANPQLDLINAAKAEGGTLTFYTTVDQQYTDNLTKAFMKAYPWAKVSFVILASDIVTKISGEVKAGKVNGDLLGTSATNTNLLLGTNILQKFPLPIVNNTINPLADPNGYWYAFEETFFGVEYNTKLVTPAQAPKSIADLADPSWNNQIAMDSPSHLLSSGVLLSNFYFTLGNATWSKIMTGIEANNPKIQGSNTAASNLAVSGQAKVAITSYGTYLVAKAGGAPVQWIWFSQQPISPILLSLPVGSTHPHMAALFAEWALSEGGQYTTAKFGFIPSDPIVANSNYFNFGIPSNTTTIYRPETYQNPFHDAVVKYFTQVFGP